MSSQRRRVGRQVRRKPALVADRGRQPLGVEQLLQRVEHLGAAAQRLAEALGADRDDHELLHVEAVVRVRAAVDDVHHRHRHLHRARAAEVAIERQPRLLGRRLGDRHRHGEQRVRAEPRLVLRPVEVDQRPVDEALLRGVEAHDRLGDLGVDVLDRLQHALAAVAGLVAVAQLERLARAGRGARRHGRPSDHARFEQHVGLDRRVAPRIEDLPRHDIDDGAHAARTLFSSITSPSPALERAPLTATAPRIRAASPANRSP